LPVPEITPANVVEALPAVVRVFVVDEPSEMLAAESLVVAVAIDATVSLLFWRLKMPTFATTSADESEMRLLPDSFTSPADIVVVPV